MTATKLLALSLTGGMMLCGAMAASAPRMTAHAATKGRIRSAVEAVYRITADPTSQMIHAGKPATFVLTASTKNGKPAVNEPVTFYIGTMVPLSGMPPTRWISSRTPAARPYIAQASRVTNRRGQATLVLSRKPANTMEMIAVAVGSLSSYSASSMTALGSLDAWWTTPTSRPSAPIGDSVTVRPFLERVAPLSRVRLSVTVDSPHGPVKHAHVLFIPKMGGMSSMGAMSNAGSTAVMTNQAGEAFWVGEAGSMAGGYPTRIVVTEGAAKGRAAGGMNSELVVP